MKLQQTFAGLEARLKPVGAGRFFIVAFLTVWLSFWVMGESFAVFALFKSARTLVTEGEVATKLIPSLAIGGFLLVWLTFWTIGGMVAGGEWLRLLFGRDRLVARVDGLELERSFGFFRRRKFFPREKIRRFYTGRTGRSGQALMVETADGAAQLTRFGTDEERAALESTLTAEFRLASRPSGDADDGVIPSGWCELATPERTSVFIRDPAVRRKQARFTWILFLTFALIAGYLGGLVAKQPDLTAALIIVSIIAVLLGWGALTLTRARDEWRLERGRLTLQRRGGQKVVPKFDAVSLQLVENSDSDGDRFFELVGLAEGAQISPQPPMSKDRRTIFGRNADPTDARNLGLWLARRCPIPFIDRTTAEAKTPDFEALRQQLANSGRLGKLAARLLAGAKPPK